MHGHHLKSLTAALNIEKATFFNHFFFFTTSTVSMTQFGFCLRSHQQSRTTDNVTAWFTWVTVASGAANHT